MTMVHTHGRRWQQLCVLGAATILPVLAFLFRLSSFLFPPSPQALSSPSPFSFLLSLPFLSLDM